jgi:sugar fermentation stimulation protein A
MRISGGAPFFTDILHAAFVGRPNRFVIECGLKGRTVRAYLPNPGRLWELLLPGRTVYLTRLRYSPERKLRYLCVAVEREGIPILLHTHVNNEVARTLIERDAVPGLEGAVVIRPEAQVGNSRFDFLLSRDGEEMLLEVKSCTLVGRRIAMFPDAVTERGTKHLRELAALSEKGRRAAVLFVVHWPKAEYFLPEHHTDLEFSRTLLAVKDRVMVRALSIGWERDLSLGPSVRSLAIPWNLIERESHDRGSYVVILRLRRDRVIEAGSLGKRKFRKGYYLYAGSAKANLTKRIERHRRLTKNLFWHIDCLRQHADWCVGLPVRTADDLECRIAQALARISDWTVPGFGCSDCSCESHLFGMDGDPIRKPEFIDLLMHFRIDRLEEALADEGPDTTAR